MSKVKTNNSAGQNCSFALKGKIHNKKAKVWNMGIDPTTTRQKCGTWELIPQPQGCVHFHTKQLSAGL
jgi:hypothetical protein